MLHVINLVPGMPTGWKEGHPAPWRRFPNYLWLDEPRGIPGQDIPWRGPGTLERVSDRIEAETGGLYVRVSAASRLAKEDLSDDVIVVNALCANCPSAVLVRRNGVIAKDQDIEQVTQALKKTLLRSSSL